MADANQEPPATPPGSGEGDVAKTAETGASAPDTPPAGAPHDEPPTPDSLTYWVVMGVVVALLAVFALYERMA